MVKKTDAAPTAVIMIQMKLQFVNNLFNEQFLIYNKTNRFHWI